MTNSSSEKPQVAADNLESLLKLQVIDYDLGELERSKEYLPDMMKTLSKEIEEVDRNLHEDSETLAQAQMDQKNIDLEVKTKEADLQKYQQQMMAIKTNKEYDALVAEIDSIKHTISDGETKLLEKMETIERLEPEISGLREKKIQVDENNSRQLKILQEKIDSIDDKVSAKDAERQEVLSMIPRATLSTYERVRRGRGGVVVIIVRKRACGSCFKALTAKKVQEIKRRDRLNTCDSCGCILYWDDDESN